MNILSFGVIVIGSGDGENNPMPNWNIYFSKKIILNIKTNSVIADSISILFSF